MKRKKSIQCPQILQMEALECGAASLAMVMAYHKKWVPLEKVRKDCGVSRDGSNAKNILRAARTYGFTAKGYRLEVKGLADVPLPCIIQWNFNHFVVFCGFRRNKAILNDPARGTVAVPIEEFNQSFTGIALIFEPGEAFEISGRPRSIAKFAIGRLKGMTSAFIFMILASMAITIIGIANPVFSRVFLDRVLTEKNPDWLLPLLAIMTAAAIIQFMVSLVQTLYLQRMEGRFAIEANAGFLWHILRLPMEFFSQRMAGDIAGRQAANQSIASTLLQALAPQLLNMGMLVLYLVVMLRYSIMLTAVGVAAILLNIIVAQLISRKRIKIAQVQARDEGKLASATAAGVDMIETLKASGAENGYFETWADYQASANTAAVRFTRTNQLLGAVPGAVQQLSQITVLGLGIFLVMNGQFTTGMLLAFQGFLTSFTSPVNSLLEAGQSIQEMRTNMERVEDVLLYPTDVPPQEEKTEGLHKKMDGSLTMRGVTFGYSSLDGPLIEDFNLDLRPGSSVAFVGSSGCGKSTLAKLISGLYKPWAGEILFDGVPLERISRVVRTASLAVVDQDITIFEDTVANNIKLWDKTIEDFEMILAAKDAQIHESILLRKDGYDYPMLEGGRDFSGGQRQRMEIARVLAQDPTIIILDEATSALDAKTEHDVVKAIKRRDITCIFIAHRLSTIRDCDEIVVLDKGKVAERGTHQQLMALDGLYTKLITTE